MRVLLVDYECKCFTFLSRALREQAYAVDVVESGEKGLKLALECSYDVILLQIRLPRLNGVDVCREFRDSGVESPILMLAPSSQAAQRVEALDAGADDFVTKPFVLAELQARIRALVRRSFNKGVASLRYADVELDRHRRKVSRGSRTMPLTSKEFAVLEFLLLRAPETVPRSEIVEHVWDLRFDSETNLVEVYINRLRQKLDHSRVPKLIHTIRGVGYRLSLPEQNTAAPLYRR